MAGFPIFLNFENKKILVVGGGKIATSKIEKLLDFTKNITIISKSFTKKLAKKINKNSLISKKRAYQKDDIKGYDIVIVATNDIKLQKNIYKEAKKQNCLFNCSDIKKYCDFTFSSFMKKDDLIVAISTSGVSPALAKQMKKYFSKLIPEDISLFLQQMREDRKSLPKGKKRMKYFQSKVKEYLKSW